MGSDEDFISKINKSFKDGITKNGFSSAVSYIIGEAKRINEIDKEKSSRNVTKDAKEKNAEEELVL